MELNCKIIVGVTGGIAAYKAPILVRRLKDQGADVRVVMTQGAKHFITALSLQAVSGHPVRDTLLDAEAESGMDHIDMARWADLVIIAPASAGFIARLAHGMADDLLSTLCLATTAKLVVSPAMNQQMWRNRATQQNIAKISENGVQILGPAQGDQACGETGPGRMLEPTDIVSSLLSHGDEKDSQTISSDRTASKPTKLRILITAGPTWEALDPVRGLTNHSSGKMGYSLASAFIFHGYETTLISGPTALQAPVDVRCINVRSAQQMHDAVHSEIANTDIFISVAAVADYRPDSVSTQKIKKSRDTMQITLVRNPDIVKSVTELDNPPFTIGFAAETNNVEGFAKDKLVAKNLEMIIANEVGADKAFGKDHNELTVIQKNSAQQLGPDTKQVLSDQLVSIITKAYADKHSNKNS